MFMFMEGLPGAGKSYETCVYYILEAIKKGRPVDAYVEGLNHQQFADLAGKPLKVVEQLLVFIPREHVPQIYNYARKDALVVIDELQNFWQSSRQKLSDKVTTFITEHRHEGQDIIGMGQDLNDVHNMWRRRTAKKFVFQTQDMVGKPDTYLWTAYQGKRTDKDIKFVKLNSGSRKYDEKYFGLYKSHSDGTSNFDTFEDKRTNVFNNKSLRYGVPFAAACLVAAVYYLSTVVFSGTGLVTQEQLGVVEEATHSTPLKAEPATEFQRLERQFESVQASIPDVSPEAISAPPDEEAIKYAEPVDYIDTVAQQYKLRLAGVITNPKTNVSIIVVQAFDNTLHLKERFTSEEINSLGWEIEITGYGARLYREDRQYVVRPWPIDPFGKVNQSTVTQL